jgi:hypothetical protein
MKFDEKLQKLLSSLKTLPNFAKNGANFKA